MRLPDGSILMHEKRPYDPAKAHEYYMRTRKLKGRKKGQQVSPNTVRKAAGMKPLSQKKRATPKQRADARQKILDLTKRLADLKDKLKERTSDKKAASKKSAAKAEASAKDAKKPDTAAEKNKSAREAKKYRDKNQQQLKTKAAAARKSGGSSKGGSGKAKASKKAGKADIKKQIAETETQLKDAIAKYRALG